MPMLRRNFNNSTKLREIGNRVASHTNLCTLKNSAALGLPTIGLFHQEHVGKFRDLPPGLIAWAWGEP